MKIDFKNKSITENVRVKVVPKSGANINIPVDEVNPTVGINNGELTFCLSPSKLWTVQYTKIDTGEIVQIDTGETVSAHLMDPDIYNENGDLIGDASVLANRDNVIINSIALQVKAFSFDNWTNLTSISSNSHTIEDKAFANSFPNVEILKNVRFGSNTRLIQNSILENRELIESLIFDDGVEALGNSVLVNSKVKSLTIPDSVTQMSDSAFALAELETLVIGGGLKIVSSNHFSQRLNTILSIEFKQGIEIIKDNWMGGGNTCTSLKFPNSLLSIGTKDDGGSTFGSYSKVSRLEIPSSVQYISKFAFQNWDSLEYLTINRGVGEIDECAFQNYNVNQTHPLKEFNFLGGEYIRAYAFQNWELEKLDFELVIPDTVIEINEAAFQNHYNTKKLTFAECVVKIDRDAFINWYKATDLYLSDSIMSIDCSFQNWYECENIYIGNGIKVLGSNTGLIQSEFANFGNRNNNETKIKKAIIPDTVETIFSAFAYSGIEQIIIGKSVKNVHGTIGGAMMTKKIFYRGLIPPVFHSPSQIVPSGHPAELICVPDLQAYLNAGISAEYLMLFTAPTDINAIHIENPIDIPTVVDWDVAYRDISTGEMKTLITSDRKTATPELFSSLNNIDDIILNSNIKTLASSALQGKQTIKRISSLNNGLENIGYNVTSGCYRLRSLHLGNNVKRIGTEAFSGAIAMSKDTIVPLTGYLSLDASAFGGWDSSIPVPVENVLAPSPTLTSVTSTVITGTGETNSYVHVKIDRLSSKNFYPDVNEAGVWILDLAAESQSLQAGDKISMKLFDIVENESSTVTHTYV